MNKPTQIAEDPENPQPVAFVDPEHDFKSPSRDKTDKGKLGPFPIWTATDFAAYRPQPDRDILGRAILREGNLTLLMGQPGLGKSTASFALAIANVRGDHSFAGIPLSPKPRRWLFIGNENGADRWKEHFEDADRTLTPEQRVTFQRQVHVAALFEDEDPDLSLPDQENRLEATVGASAADVVVLDPWSEIVPNEIDSAIVRDSIASLRNGVRRANRHAAILVVCHAKAGREVVADNLSNFGAGNAQRGNRLLYSSARAALLLVPFDDHGSDLVLALAKCNDGPLMRPQRIAFDREAFRYTVNQDFNVEEWSESLRAKTKPKRKVAPETIEALVRKGHTSTKAIVSQLAARAGERTIKDAIGAAVDLGLILKIAHGIYGLNLK
jgi:hypothetical protein